MSDNFIPLNQSTPVQNKSRWQNNSYQQRSWNQNQRRGGGYNRRSHYSQRSGNSFGSDRSHRKESIDAYLHPSMLQDPWAFLRRRDAENQSL